MTSIAAIVCGHTLDRWADIEQAIDSLHRQTRAADQIIFSVDNNPDLFEQATQAFPDIAVVHNEGIKGVSPARNAAARVATCDVLAYLDDDAVADKRWIERLLSWYDDADVVGVGGTANPAWDGDADGPAWFPPSFNWVIGCSHSGIASEPAPVRNFIGCNMSIRKTAWHAVGGFDDGLGRVGADGAGGDETDFCIRVTETVGGTIMNDPSAIVSHRVPESRQTLSYFVKRCRSEGRSKAQIASRAGADQALSEERKHLLGELPKSFFAGLTDTLKGDLGGIGRSAAIVLGTGATGFGYLAGKVHRGAGPTPNVDFEPVSVLSVDVGVNSVGVAGAAAAQGRPAFVVVRNGAQLLGTRRFDRLPDATSLLDEVRRDFPESATSPSATSASGSSATAAVVIATRDRAASLERCLDSVAAMTHRPDQIIVVDNAPSTDETKDLVQAWSAAGAIDTTYVRCAKPGLAVAHNAALPYVESEVVAFTDDDVVVDPHWLEQLIIGFDAADDVACVTGAIMPAELDTWPQEWVESTSNFTKGFESETFSYDSPRHDPLFPFTAGSMGSGANMAFRSAWLRNAGGFDGALGAGTRALGGDDLRAFYDVIDSGQSLHFSPGAVVFHHHHRTSDAIERQAYGYGAGLTAFLTSVIVNEPAAAVRMAKQARAGVSRARQITKEPASHYPGARRRSWRQRMGMLTGPVRYLRSRVS